MTSEDISSAAPSPAPLANGPAALAAEVVDLVSLPEIYLRVKELVESPDSSLEDLAEVITVDPGLTVRILRLANSAYLGLASRIHTVARAITLLGTRQIHDFVLATSVVRSFAGIPPGIVDMERFWRASVLCGASARLLADRRGIPDSERMFVAGLLARTGRLVLYLQRPDSMGEVHALAGQQALPLHEAEERVLGFDEAAVAGELLGAWNLPPTLMDPIRHQSRPLASRLNPLESSLLHVACAIADDPEADVEAADLVSRLDGPAWSTTGLGPDDIDEIRSEAMGVAAEIAELFLPRKS